MQIKMMMMMMMMAHDYSDYSGNYIDLGNYKDDEKIKTEDSGKYTDQGNGDDDDDDSRLQRLRWELKWSR